MVILAAAPESPQPSNPATLVLRRSGGEAEAYLKFASPIFSKRPVVHASVDGGPSKDWHLSPSTDRLSAFFKSGPQLLERLLASKQLRIGYGRRKPLENDAGELVFSLAGLYEASLPWVEACAVDLDRVKDGLGKLEGD